MCQYVYEYREFHDDQGLKDQARYIVCACFSDERMTYLPAKDSPDGRAKVIYRSKDRRVSRSFAALDWLAQLVTHIPNKGESMVCNQKIHQIDPLLCPKCWGVMNVISFIEVDTHIPSIETEPTHGHTY